MSKPLSPERLAEIRALSNSSGAGDLENEGWEAIGDLLVAVAALTEQVSQLTAERDEWKKFATKTVHDIKDSFVNPIRQERDRLAERLKRLREHLKEAQIMFEAMALAKPSAKQHFDHFSTQWKDALAEDDKMEQVKS